MVENNDKQWKLKSIGDMFETAEKKFRKKKGKVALGNVFFGMKGKDAKTSAKSQEVQAYLNHDYNKNPIYIQTGWLDAVGISHEGFAKARFDSFDNEMDVWAFDHLFVRARL